MIFATIVKCKEIIICSVVKKVVLIELLKSFLVLTTLVCSFRLYRYSSISFE